MSPTPYTLQHAAIGDADGQHTRGDDLLHHGRLDTDDLVNQYTGAIPVSTTTTINAIAAGRDCPSTVASGTYTITAATPSMSPAPYTYTARNR